MIVVLEAQPLKEKESERAIKAVEMAIKRCLNDVLIIV
jgi:hypothetical protein